jgi:hypothetical protein
MRTDKLSYQEVHEWFKKARNPENGRPVQSWARMYQVGENYELRLGTNVVGVFTPDNKFTFKLTSSQARSCSVTLSQALARAIPFVWERKGMGRYVVKPTPAYAEYKKSNPDDYAWSYFSKQHGCEVFDGLCFDLNTYEPVNARVPLTKQAVNKDNKLEWLRALRKFKLAVKIRARMGVLESLIQQVDNERKGQSRYDWVQPDWNSDKWQDVLYTSIKSSECSTDLLKGFITSVRRGYYSSKTTVNEVIDEVDKVCTTYSLDLRRRFGVYDEVSEMQSTDEVSRHPMGRSNEGNAP